MNIAHGYPANPFPPSTMTLEFHSRHQRVKDDIDDGILAQVFPGKPARKTTKIRYVDLHDYAKKRSAADPAFHWLIEFCEAWAEVLYEMSGATKKRRQRRTDPREEERLAEQRRLVT